MLDLVHFLSLCQVTELLHLILRSFSFQDGEEGRISPSLANTESKTSDVIEPPYCPMNFDNLEDVFAPVSQQIK